MKIAKSQLRRIIRDQINTEGIVDIGKSLFKAVDIYTDATSESDDPLADDDENDDKLEENMKVTKRQLKRIIREERAKLKETSGDLTTDYAVSKMTEEEEVEETDDKEELEEARLRRRLRRRLRKANLTELGIDRTPGYTDVGDTGLVWPGDLADYVIQHIYEMSTAAGVDLEDPQVLRGIAMAMEAVKTEFAIP